MEGWSLLFCFILIIVPVGIVAHRHGGNHVTDLGHGGDWGSHGSGEARSALMQFIVTKGCHYLAGFVHSHYVHGHSDHKGNVCHWQRWVIRKCAELNVPNMLSSALITCGSSVSMSTLNAPPLVLRLCNMTSHMMSRPFGKRHHGNVAVTNGTRVNLTSLIQSLRQHDTASVSVMHTLDEHRMTSLSTETDKDTSRQNNHLFPVPTLRPGSELLKWCYSFSSYINKKYHFNEIGYVQRSAYWLEDVYQIAPKFGVPVSYTHALVGCGMDVALNALNAPKWLSLLYVPI